MPTYLPWSFSWVVSAQLLPLCTESCFTTTIKHTAPLECTLQWSGDPTGLDVNLVVDNSQNQLYSVWKFALFGSTANQCYWMTPSPTIYIWEMWVLIHSLHYQIKADCSCTIISHKLDTTLLSIQRRIMFTSTHLYTLICIWISWHNAKEEQFNILKIRNIFRHEELSVQYL